MFVCMCMRAQHLFKDTVGPSGMDYLNKDPRGALHTHTHTHIHRYADETGKILSTHAHTPIHSPIMHKIGLTTQKSAQKSARNLIFIDISQPAVNLCVNTYDMYVCICMHKTD